MSNEPITPITAPCLELPVDELMRRARPLPAHGEMVIEGLEDAEGDAFLAALKE